jgi:hypothetical protein
MALNIFGGGLVGKVITALNANGQSQSANLPAFMRVDSTGAELPGGTSSAPTVTQRQGAGTVATSQAATSVSPATSTSLVAARAGRQSVTLTNITGTQPIYITAAAGTTGATIGFPLAGVAGASVTIETTAALFGTSPTAAQTVGVLETF